MKKGITEENKLNYQLLPLFGEDAWGLDLRERQKNSSNRRSGGGEGGVSKYQVSDRHIA